MDFSMATYGAAVPGAMPINLSPDPKLDFTWLLSQQSANGMFKCSPTDGKFSAYSGKNIDKEVEGKLKDTNVLKGVLATLFALAALQKQFAARKTEWQFMFAKGKSWVSKQLTNKA